MNLKSDRRKLKENTKRGSSSFGESLFVRDEMMVMDLNNAIQQAAINFQNLLPLVYDLVISRKGKAVLLSIQFLPEHFYHLCGFQHFTMNTYLRTAPKLRVYQDILNGKIDTHGIVKQALDVGAAQRIECVSLLESYLDADELVLRWDYHQKHFSRIRADYLMDVKQLQPACYIFLERDKSGMYYCKSMFPSADDVSGEYTKGLSKFVLLYKRKRNLQTGTTVIQVDSGKLTEEQRIEFGL